ncbi:MAG: hypothetical protein WC382_06745 [Methanoregulaceae archaeon]
MNDLQCPHCGSPVVSDPDNLSAHCGGCGSYLFQDSAGVSPVSGIPFTLSAGDARDVFMRWAAGPDMAVDLEKKVIIQDVSRQFFPLFRFRMADAGKTVVVIRPARVSTLPGLSTPGIPAGDIRVWDQNFDPGDAEVLDIAIPPSTYIPDLRGELNEQAIIYVPIFTISYGYDENAYLVVIDGATGQVYPGLFPVRSSRPYGVVMGAGVILGFAGVAGGLLVSPLLYLLLAVGFAGAFIGGFLLEKGR